MFSFNPCDISWLFFFVRHTSSSSLQFFFLFRVFTQQKVDDLNGKRSRLQIKGRINNFWRLRPFLSLLLPKPLLVSTEQSGKKSAGRSRSCSSRSALQLCCGLILSIRVGCLDFGGPQFPHRTWLNQMIFKVSWFFEISKKILLNTFLFCLEEEF